MKKIFALIIFINVMFVTGCFFKNDENSSEKNKNKGDEVTVVNPPVSNDPDADILSFSVNTHSGKYVYLNWVDNTDKENGYRIQRSTDENFPDEGIIEFKIDFENSNIFAAQTLANGLEQYVDYNNNPDYIEKNKRSSLEENTTYYYRIKAYNTDGSYESDWYTASPVYVPSKTYTGDAIRILFVGNSGFSNNGRLQTWLEVLDSFFPGSDLEIKYINGYYVGGGGLIDHWERSEDKYPTVWASIRAELEDKGDGYYKYVILQEWDQTAYTQDDYRNPASYYNPAADPTISDPDADPDIDPAIYKDISVISNNLYDSRFWLYLRKFTTLIKNNGSVPILFQAHVCPQSTYNDYKQYVKDVTEQSELAAKVLDIKVIRACRGFDLIRYGVEYNNEASGAYDDDNFENYNQGNENLIDMHYNDGHPSPAGNYMFACLTYAVLFDKNPENITFPNEVNGFAIGLYGLAKDKAVKIQKAAREIYTTYP